MLKTSWSIEGEWAGMTPTPGCGWEEVSGWTSNYSNSHSFSRGQHGQLAGGLGLDVEWLQPWPRASFVAGDDELANLRPQRLVARRRWRLRGRRQEPRRLGLGVAPRPAALAPSRRFRLEHLAHLGRLDRRIDGRRRLASARRLLLEDPEPPTPLGVSPPR